MFVQDPKDVPTPTKTKDPNQTVKTKQPTK